WCWRGRGRRSRRWSRGWSWGWSRSWSWRGRRCRSWWRHRSGCRCRSWIRRLWWVRMFGGLRQVRLVLETYCVNSRWASLGEVGRFQRLASEVQRFLRERRIGKRSRGNHCIALTNSIVEANLITIREDQSGEMHLQTNTVSGGTSLVDFVDDPFYVRLVRNCDLRAYNNRVAGLQVD